MPVPKLRGSDRFSLMKPDGGNDFLNSFLRQTTAKEPFLSFSRAGDVPVQLIQLLSALDQQDISGWPLLSPAKVQKQKCGKCTQEYCSSINYRRHLRVHHRLKKLDKDSLKSRELLGVFWDKMTEDEAKAILSFKDVMLGEVPGSSILKSLTVAIQSPGYYSLPQYCWKAGSSLLDIIQATRFPLSSKELFSILDDASEKTFLSGTAVSVQNYIFNGDAGKIGLEMKNIAACVSFLLEKKLVKAWLADKDAEALRCQKLLMEEEETAQRRQAELLEKRRQKKLRQKEQKAKDQNQRVKADVRELVNDGLEAAPEAEQPCGLGTSDPGILGSRTLPHHVASSLEPYEFQNMEEDRDLEAETISGSEDDMDSDQNLVEHHIVERNGSGNTAIECSHMPQKSQRSNLSNGVHVNSNSQAHKIVIVPKHENHYDSRASPLVSGIRKWSRKSILDGSRQSLKSIEQKSTVSQLENNKKSEVLIGSIAVTIGNCGQPEVSNSDEAGNVYLPENQRLKKYNLQEKHSRPSFMCSSSRPTVMYWRPVSRDGNKEPKVAEIGNGESLVDGINNKNQSSKNCLRSSVVDSDCSRVVCSYCPRSPVRENGSKDPELVEISNRESEIDEVCNCQSTDNCLNPTTVDNDLSRVARESIPPTKFQFSCIAAKAFLSERWKQAISSEHVKLTLPKDFEPSGHLETKSQMACGESLVVGNDIDRTSKSSITGVRTQDGGASSGTIKHRFRKKPEKGFKLKYIPK